MAESPVKIAKVKIVAAKHLGSPEAVGDRAPDE